MSRNIGFLLLFCLGSAGFVAWRLLAAQHDAAQFEIVEDPSASHRGGCESLVGLAESVVASDASGPGSTLTVLVLGDQSTASEPWRLASYAVPAIRKVLEGRSAKTREEQKIVSDIATRCRSVRRTTTSPIFLAVTQTTGSGTYTYANDVASALPVVLQESGPDGNVSYVYGLGLISESGPGFDFFYQYNGLGSVVGLTDPNAKLAGRYSYDAWGNTDASVPAPQLGTENKFRYTGEALDPGTQLYYLRARYYDPSVGRFVGKDPSAGFKGNIALQLNRYLYGGNNPVKNLDPDGLSFFGDLWTKAAAVSDVLARGSDLSTEIFLKGTIDAINFVTANKITQLTNASTILAQGEQVTAQKLIASEVQVAGINISQTDQADIAKQVVQITNLASDVLNAGLFVSETPQAIGEISHLSQEIRVGGWILKPSLTLGSDITNLFLNTVGFGQTLVGSPK